MAPGELGAGKLEDLVETDRAHQAGCRSILHQPLDPGLRIERAQTGKGEPGANHVPERTQANHQNSPRVGHPGR